MSEWLPIESAPKDQEIVVSGFKYNDEKAGRFFSVAVWDVDGWGDAGGHGEHLYPPTHWIPLPSPPNNAKVSEGE